jgi:adhesin/invasin
MHRYLKFVPLLAILAFGAVWATWPQSAGATPFGPPTWTGPGTNGLFTITASYTDDTPVGSTTAVLSNFGGAGNFVAPATLSPQSDETISLSSTTVTVSEDSDTIPQTKTITVNFQCLTAGATATFTISHGGITSGSSTVLNCGSFVGNFPTFPTYPGYPTYPPTYNPTGPIYNVATTIGISASPSSLNCGSAATVAVTVRDASGNMVYDGTSVNLSASMGTISPTTGSTSGGIINAVYTAPSSGGTAVITASSGSASGQATVTISCAVGAAPPASVPPPVYAPPAIGTAIYPPNTGDAGLADSHGSTRLPAALAVALTVLAGGALLGGWSYRRERAR